MHTHTAWPPGGHRRAARRRAARRALARRPGGGVGRALGEAAGAVGWGGVGGARGLRGAVELARAIFLLRRVHCVKPSIRRVKLTHGHARAATRKNIFQFF